MLSQKKKKTFPGLAVARPSLGFAPTLGASERRPERCFLDGLLRHSATLADQLKLLRSGEDGHEGA